MLELATLRVHPLGASRIGHDARGRLQLGWTSFACMRGAVPRQDAPCCSPSRHHSGMDARPEDAHALFASQTPWRLVGKGILTLLVVYGATEGDLIPGSTNGLGTMMGRDHASDCRSCDGKSIFSRYHKLHGQCLHRYQCKPPGLPQGPQPLFCTDLDSLFVSKTMTWRRGH